MDIIALAGSFVNGKRAAFRREKAGAGRLESGPAAWYSIGMKKWLIISLCVALCCCLGAVRYSAADQEPQVVPAEDAPAEDAADTPAPEPTPDPNRPMVALTFDDGPNPTKTAPLLDLLEKYHVKATFFVLGTSISETTRPLLQRMVDQGCEIGIHGLDHSRMDKISAKNLKRKLTEVTAIISDQIEGGYTPRLMRPPGGHCNGTLQAVTKELGLPVILWSVDTLDWKSGRDAVLKALRNKTRDGSIILCHDKGYGTLEALEAFLPQLLSQGYDLVTVSELLARHGDPVEPGVVYRSVAP